MGMGIAGSIGGASSAQAAAAAQAKQRNEDLIKQYEYQLKITKQKNLNQNQVWAQKLGIYNQANTAADRAAERAYGMEMSKENQRLRQAALTATSQAKQLAASSGAATAAGKSGRNALRSDRRAENDFVYNQNVMAENLLASNIAADYRKLAIRDQLESQYNQNFSDVAIAPKVPMQPLEPTLHTAPQMDTAGMMLGIGNSVMKGLGSIMQNTAPDPGNFGFGNMGSMNVNYSAPAPNFSSMNWDAMSSSLPSFGSGSFSSPTPITSGLNFGF